MKLIVGLGNPGSEYDRTRHNAGYLVVDRLLARHAPDAPARARFHSATWDVSIDGERALLLKPTTYMNRSGLAVGEAVRFFKLEPSADLLVVTDDVALPAGAIRLRASGGTGGHKGLGDIERALATDEYARLRIGIDPPGLAPQTDYVLGRFSPDQWAAVDPALDKAADCAERWALEGAIAAMNEFNQRAPSSGWGAFNPNQSSPNEGDTHTREQG